MTGLSVTFLCHTPPNILAFFPLFRLLLFNYCLIQLPSDDDSKSKKSLPPIILLFLCRIFHIFFNCYLANSSAQVGEDKPLFVSPQSSSYLTGGAWSPTRPAVLLVACDSGKISCLDCLVKGGEG